MVMLLDWTHLKTTPFPCSMLSDFVVDKDGKLLELKEELMRLKFHQKNNDLYQFKQVCVVFRLHLAMCFDCLRCISLSQMI